MLTYFSLFNPNSEAHVKKSLENTLSTHAKEVKIVKGSNGMLVQTN